MGKFLKKFATQYKSRNCTYCSCDLKDTTLSEVSHNQIRLISFFISESSFSTDSMYFTMVFVSLKFLVDTSGSEADKKEAIGKAISGKSYVYVPQT